jgi:FkbH-like protein
LPTKAFEEPIIVNVWRNHSFEPLQPMVASYAGFWDRPLTFRLGDYDDSFSFHGFQDSSVELLWMDSTRYMESINFPEWLDWLQGRIVALRQYSSAPIILATWLADKTQRMELGAQIEKFPAVYFADLEETCKTEGVPLLDSRSATLAGTVISSYAQVILARALACRWLAGVALPPIKAIAVDLDNTLHKGVLGEDGIESVKLTPAHKNLQRYLKTLQQRGIFITLVSRNEFADVRALFDQRTDYPLRWDDFSVVEVSWGDKADALQRISQTLRISTDAILFIDDNPGELAAVTQRIPNLKTLYAESCANLTKLAIEYYPGLWRWKQESDDAKRIQDLKASFERASLALTHTDPTEYLSSLRVTLTYFCDTRQQLGRLSDLCSKTNQFNLALRRFNEAELSERMNCLNACVASVQLSDRLSDSGIIAVIVAEREDDHLRIEELCISCRAMGRHLESDIIVHAMRQMPIWAGCRDVEFRVRHGERNKPALAWLAHLVNSLSITLPDSQAHIIPIEAFQNAPQMQGVFILNGE